MILTGQKIISEVQSGNINIDPFNIDAITTNTYDLTLGNTLIRYTSETIDPKKPPEYETITIPSSGYEISSGTFLLGHSQEVIGSDHYVPIIHARSSTARLGLFVHVTADLIDIGSHGHTTFQLYATLPIVLYSGMKIAQVSFWKPTGEIVLYKGKYQKSTGPVPSQIHQDFK